MHHLTDGHWSLEELLGSTAMQSLRERLAGSPPRQAIQEVQAFLAQAVRTVRRVIPAHLVHAAQRIMANPQTRMEALAHDMGLSERHLERHFQDVIGLPPKSFASIARFQAALRQLGQTSSLADAAILCGYYDQAHLSNVLKRFTGRTAKALMSDFSKNRQAASR
jgi:AraC-like DNA-binding protein